MVNDIKEWDQISAVYTSQIDEGVGCLFSIRILPKKELDVDRIILWASIFWLSSHAKVTYVNSVSSLISLKAETTLFWKSFHWRKYFPSPSSIAELLCNLWRLNGNYWGWFPFSQRWCGSYHRVMGHWGPLPHTLTTLLTELEIGFKHIYLTPKYVPQKKKNMSSHN